MRADPVLDAVQADLAAAHRALAKFVSATRASALIEDLRTTVGGTPNDIFWQALYADCLRVVHCAAMADGAIEDREIDALYDIIAVAARHYTSGLSSYYGELVVNDRETARAFLDGYAADRGPFGRGARLRWLGLTLCRRAAELGEREALQCYAKAMTAMSAEACRIGRVPAGDSRLRPPADELDELRRILASEATAMTRGIDRRVQAFLAPCRVFSAVQQASSIYENDPFDVEEVHHEARASFQQLVTQATMRPQPPDLGRMLVVLGDSGSGKTHVLRGFRRHVHEGSRGFVVYAQLQSRSEDYSRYLLVHLVDSLSRRYSEQSGKTGLRELASGLLRLAGSRLRERIEALADDTWKGAGTLADYVDELVNDLLQISELGRFDRDLLRVLLYALRPDPRTTSSVCKYLRCDAMNPHDRHWIGDVIPRTRDDDPHWMILDLAGFAAVTQRALVFMVDQVDLAGFDADSTRIFRRAIDALYRIVSESSSAVAVIACLSDLYSAARPELNRPALDRLENAPPIARLKVNRSYREIEAVVARRLSFLFAEHGTVHRPEQPVYPIPQTELQQLENRRLRDVLEWCHQFQTQCAAAGKIIRADEPVHVEIKNREVDLDSIAVAWSEATLASDLESADDAEEILAVVAEAAKAYAHEMGLTLVAPAPKKGLLRLRMSRGVETAALAIAVVNQNYHGGAFPSQIDSLRRRARGMVPVAVRNLEFPRGRACNRAMGQLMNVGGRGVHVDASTMRALVAFQRFQPPFPADRISAWQLRDRPLSSLPAVAEIFDFDGSRVGPSDDPDDTESSPTLDPAEANEALMRAAFSEPGAGITSPASIRDASSPKLASNTETSGPFPMVWPSERTSDAGLNAGAHAKVSVSDGVSAQRLNQPEMKWRGVSTEPPEAMSGLPSETPRPQPPDVRRPQPPWRLPLEPSSVRLPEPPAAPQPLEQRKVQRPTASTPPPPPAPMPHPVEVRSTAPEGIVKPQSPSSGPRTLQRTATAPVRQLLAGNSTGLAAEPILLEPESLLRHIAIVDNNGNGRIAAMLNLVEQVLERDVPAIVMDRTGEMSGYGRPGWWEHSTEAARARRLAERIDVRLFTPGILSGRPLSIAMIPDLSQVQESERDRAVRLAVGTLATTLPAAGAADSARLALLHDAIGTLARCALPCGLVELIALLETGFDERGTSGGDQEVRQRLIVELSLLLSKAEVFAHGAEPLTAATLISRKPGGRVPFAIINTSFLGEGQRLAWWTAQLIACLNQGLTARASKSLQVVLALDGAESLLPATAGSTSAKDPLPELLPRAKAMGLGLVLASQKPAELDYARCTAVDRWFVGKTDEATQNKMKGLFKHRPLGHRNLIRLESARFVMLDEDGSREVERVTPLLRVEQIGAAELRTLAAHTRSQVAPPQGRSDASGSGGGHSGSAAVIGVPRP